MTRYDKEEGVPMNIPMRNVTCPKCGCNLSRGMNTADHIAMCKGRTEFPSTVATQVKFSIEQRLSRIERKLDLVLLDMAERQPSQRQPSLDELVDKITPRNLHYPKRGGRQ